MGYLLDKMGKVVSPGALMVLYLSDEMDLDAKLPELYALLGEAMTMTFLEIFGGRTVAVPSVGKVREAYKAVSAYVRIEELSGSNTEDEAVSLVAAELDMSSAEVHKARRSVRAVLTRLEEAVQDAAKG